MTVAIPIIAAFGAVAEAGSVVAAMSTVGGFLSVAGGVLAGVGALSGNQDLKRLGGLMTLGSGVASLANAAGAAADAAGEAASATAQSDFRTSELNAAKEAPPLGSSAAPTTGVPPSSPAGQSLTNVAAQRVGGTLAPVTAPDATGAQLASATAPPMPATPPGTQVPGDTAATAPTTTPTPAPGDVAPPAGGPSTVPNAGAPIGSEYPNPVQPDQIANAGKSMTQTDLQKYLSQAWDRTQGLLKNTSGVLRDNKELVSIVGQAFSPQAEQLDWQKSIYNRRRQALNSPVALGPRPPGA